MTKRYQLKDLDCANCAAKMENAINKINGVNKATVSFMTQKLVIDAEDGRFQEIMKEVVRVCKKVEPDCTIQM
ncbi:cation transporter [Diplocloster modestus]|uniref:Cation transporter n=1 Tax=Diplocloster modestus TaxID=2850322 RepID=A0ABS6KC80_9FIRM|nr:cation transporter [Diplocloster modestus]MBU9728098.1 cation transporter [Diplocloster modestus]